jgi:hypothetical protein
MVSVGFIISLVFFTGRQGLLSASLYQFHFMLGFLFCAGEFPLALSVHLTFGDACSSAVPLWLPITVAVGEFWRCNGRGSMIVAVVALRLVGTVMVWNLDD